MAAGMAIKVLGSYRTSNTDIERNAEMLSYSQRKTIARDGAAKAEAWVSEGLSAAKAAQAAESAERKAAYEIRHAPVPFTDEQLKAAKAVRTTLGWHKVVKVNAKSVTVETGYSWTDRHPLSKILEVR